MIKHSIISLLVVGGACADAGEDPVGEVSQAAISFNGKSLNGMSFNGTSVNGRTLNGMSFNGASVNGISVNGGALTARSTSGPPLAGSNLVGSTWTATLSDGTAVKLRIDTAVPGAAPNPDLWFYGISYQTAAGWNPLCGVDAGSGKAIQAVSVAGVWQNTAADATHYTTSTTEFTLACRGATIAKCVELGYKTYKGYTNQLLSCVRLLRGDYCGTGSAYTVDGTLLNLYDNVGVQRDTEAWRPEAEWTPTGARCINSSNSARYELVLSKDPKCVKHTVSATCGTTFADGAILIDELP
jgi:hypothetical protein